MDSVSEESSDSESSDHLSLSGSDSSSEENENPKRKEIDASIIQLSKLLDESSEEEDLEQSAGQNIFEMKKLLN